VPSIKNHNKKCVGPFKAMSTEDWNEEEEEEKEPKRRTFFCQQGPML
jgi:hypothetical protein